ncbi:MAG: glycosyltransferase [Planctomycetota bacterium]
MSLPREVPRRATEPTRSLPPLHFHGVVLGPSGFATEGREWLACLEAAGFFPSLAGARLGDLDAPLPAADVERIRRCAGRPRHAASVDFHHMLVPHFAPLPGATWTVLHTVFETESLPPEFAARAKRADLVLVLTDWNRRTFAAGGVPEEKLIVVPPPIVPRTTALPSREADSALRRPFRWLSVFDWTLRKGPDLLLAAFARAFRAGEAELIIKTTPRTGRPVGQLQAVARAAVAAAATGTPPAVRVLEDVLDDGGMAELYAASDGFVLASRGEAWGRPVHEAMLMRLPVVVPAAHACATLVPSDDVGYPVAARRVRVSAAAADETPQFRGQEWHEVDLDALSGRMREVVSDPRQAAARAARGRSHVLALTDPHAVAARLRRILAQPAPA